METFNEENNRSDELEKRKENVSICMIKELFTETFKMKEEIIRRIIFSCITNTIAQLDRKSKIIVNSYINLIKNRS